MDEFTSRDIFFKYVEYTTSRFCHHNLTARRLALEATLREPAEIDIVNGCLQSLLKNGVRKLVIRITNSPDDVPTPKYRLPNILLSVSVLKSLTIRGCELPSSFMVDAVKFKSLIELRLEDVPIDDEAIKYLTTSCPLLQVFQVIRCHGFKRFCVSQHQNLQEVWIDFNTPVEIIDIEAPNLTTLSVIDDYLRGGVPLMKLASCKKLKSVTYFGHISNANAFTDLLSNFPFIENLSFSNFRKCNNLKFSSHSLRTLVLHNLGSEYDLEEIEFNTPNLVSFTYPCDDDGIITVLFAKRCPLLRDSTHLKGCMQCYPHVYIDTLWFQKLRQFLDKSGFKVLNLYIRAKYIQSFLEFEKLKAIELPPYELEHVELQLETHDESLAHIAFVDAVLWCCRPRSLTLRSSLPLTDFEGQSDVVKFTYEKLLQQEYQGHTNIQIVSPFSSKAISFKKEEVPQEEAGSQRFAALKIF